MHLTTDELRLLIVALGTHEAEYGLQPVEMALVGRLRAELAARTSD